MVSTFIEKITDDKQRRIKIDKDAWDKEKLKKGDYIKVTIEKVILEK
jgi:hypothetical protein